MEFENLVKLIQAVSDSELTQFSYEEKGVSLTMKKEKKEKIIAVENASMPQVSAVGLNGSLMELGEAQKEASFEGNLVKSPLVGTFYTAPSPEEDPFVKVGDTVSKGQVLGIVEAMKLMNEIESEYDGVIKQILVSNEDVIEFGQPLFVIE